MIKHISGKVIHGKKLWRVIGFPTANLSIKKWLISDGTYKINIIIQDQIYHWAGVYRENIELFEAHIFHFSWDLYWQNIEVFVLEKIRENKKVTSLEEVKDLITADVKTIQSKTNYVLTFGTFDLVHEGHKYYLNQAKKYWDKLVTIVATDNNVLKFKWKLPKNNQSTRLQDVRGLNISDLVILGWETQHLDWIELYDPAVVCLWYDQVGFADILKKHISLHQLDIQIIRLSPFQENIYKSSLLKK